MKRVIGNTWQLFSQLSLCEKEKEEENPFRKQVKNLKRNLDDKLVKKENQQRFKVSFDGDVRILRVAL